MGQSCSSRETPKRSVAPKMEADQEDTKELDSVSCETFENEESVEIVRQQGFKMTLLQGQRDREESARQSGELVMNQRVRYLKNKAKGTVIDKVHVVGVHSDHEPYYTIQYRNDNDNDESLVEKQTTRDRLETVEWDDELSWEILSAKL
jgi:hypothetical protein